MAARSRDRGVWRHPTPFNARRINKRICTCHRQATRRIYFPVRLATVATGDKRPVSAADAFRRGWSDLSTEKTSNVTDAWADEMKTSGIFGEPKTCYLQNNSQIKLNRWPSTTCRGYQTHRTVCDFQEFPIGYFDRLGTRNIFAKTLQLYANER